MEKSAMKPGDIVNSRQAFGQTKMSRQNNIKQRMRAYQFMTSEEYQNKEVAEIPSCEVWKEFQDKTTAHGIPHVKNARGPIKTAFWVLASLLSCGLLIYYAYLLFDKFFHYPVNVKVDMINMPRLDFPAVTACNHSPMRRERLRRGGNDELSSLHELFSEGEDPADVNDTPTSNSGSGPGSNTGSGPGSGTGTGPGTGTGGAPGFTNSAMNFAVTTEDPLVDNAETDNNTIYEGDEGFQAGTGRSLDGRPTRQDFELFTRVQELLADIDDDETKRWLGTQKEDFILDCEYSGAFCYPSDFAERYYSATYGNCFTFNLGQGENDTELKESYRTGPKYGLAITFNIDQEEYLGNVAHEAGVRIVVHSRDRMPFPEDEGVSVIPGQESFLGIRMLMVTRLGDNYGPCVDHTISNIQRNVYEERYGVRYSATACFKTCYQRHVINTCGCSDPMYPRRGSAFNYARVRSCKSNIERQINCLTNVFLKYQAGRLSCDCPIACSEKSYITTLSGAAWPSVNYKTSLLESLATSNQNAARIINDESNRSKYKDNFLKTVIYFEEFNYEQIQETPAYESFNLISDLGGILGLFIGFSVLTLGEFLELGADLLLLNLIKCCSVRRRRRTSSAVPVNVRTDNCSNRSSNESMSVTDIADDSQPFEERAGHRRRDNEPSCCSPPPQYRRDR